MVLFTAIICVYALIPCQKLLLYSHLSLNFLFPVKDVVKPPSQTEFWSDSSVYEHFFQCFFIFSDPKTKRCILWVVMIIVLLCWWMLNVVAGFGEEIEHICVVWKPWTTEGLIHVSISILFIGYLEWLIVHAIVIIVY